MSWDRATIRNHVKEGKSMKGLKFTKANLDELRPAEREYFVWSVDLPGFGIRVLPSGKKSFVVQFRLAEGKTIRKTIGTTRIVPITMATERAQQLLAHAHVHKVDLMGQERADALARIRRRDSTVGSIVSAYLAEPATNARRSIGETRRYLESVWADVRDLDAETCTRHDLLPTLRRIAAERGSVTANRAKASLSAMFTWAITHGLLQRDNSPTAFLPTWEEKARERALSLEELGQVWQAAALVNPTFGAMVRLLILTGCRRSEISDLSWSEVDFSRGAIELPGSRVKNGLPHTVPMSGQCVAILAGVPGLGDGRIFQNFRAWSWAKQRLDALAPMKPWVVHDLRRSVSTGLHEHLNGDGHLIELILNHSSGSRGSIAGIYDRSQRLTERRALLEKWADLVLAAAGESAPVTAVNVVRIGR